MNATLNRQPADLKVTVSVNAVMSAAASVSSGASGCETFGSSIRKAFMDGKLSNLIDRAEADYLAGKALDSLD